MAKKLKVEEVVEAPVEQAFQITDDFGREDLNRMRDAINALLRR